MRHSIILCSLVTCSTLACYAGQDTKQYSGQITDEAGKPLGFATVAMLRADSTLINGTTTDAEGRFSLSSEEAVSLLKISSVGYEHLYLDAQSFTSPIRMRPSSVMLQGVEAKAKRPQVKLSGGGLVLGVQGTTLMYQPDVLSLLGQVPGISTKAEGEVGLISGGKLLILLNGREVHSIDEVRALDVKQVKSVRLETSPSSRYRGDVSAVLHIQTLKRGSGLYLRANQWSRVNSKFSHEEEAQVGYTTPKANYSALLSYGDRRQTRESENLMRRLESTPEEELHSIIQEDHTRKGARLQTSADFTLSPKLSLGAKYNASLWRNNIPIIDRSKAYIGGNLSEEIISRGLPNDKNQSHHINAFASYQVNDKLGLTLNADLFAKRIDNEQRTLVESLTSGTTSPIDTDTKTNNLLWQVNPVLSYSLVGGKALEFGLEAQGISSDSHQDHNRGGRASDYSNTERLYAGFGGYRFALKGWSVQLGLRYEYAQSRMDNHLTRKRETDKTYSNLFYNAQLSGQIGKTMHSLSLKSYIRRPSLEQLSDNSYQSSKYLRQESNPRLINEKNYQLSYNLMFDFLYLGIDYSYIQDPINQYIYADPSVPNAYVISVDNYDKAHRLQVIANANKTWGWYNLNATGGYLFSKILGERQQVSVSPRPALLFKLTQGITLPKRYHMSLEYSYHSKLTEGTFDVEARHQLSFWATKSFFSDRLQVSLRIEDILHSAKYKVRTQMGGIKLANSNYSDDQSVSLKFVYRLNKEKSYRGKDTARDGINRL